MPLKSKFRPNPNDVQSGYYVDRMGTRDNSIKVDGAMHKSAAQENTQSRQASAGLGGGVPHPAVLAKALANGGQLPAGDDESAAHDRFSMVKSSPSGVVTNPYVNQDVVQSGWYTPPATSSSADADGMVDFDAFQAEHFAKANGAEDPDLLDEEEDEELEASARPRRVRKHYAPASEDSTHPEVHNASDHTGLDDPAHAESWATKELYAKSLYDSWMGDYAGTPLEAEAIQCELDYARKRQKMNAKKYEGRNRDQYYRDLEFVRQAYDVRREELRIRLLEHQKAEADQRVKMNKSHGLDEMEEWIVKSERPEVDPATAAEILDTFLAKGDYASGHDPSGRGDMPEAGDPPHQFPTRQRPADGSERGFRKKPGHPADPGVATVASTSREARQDGNLYEGQAQTWTAGFDDIEYSEDDVDLQQMAGGTRMAGMSSRMTKSAGQFVDWSNALERSHQLRSMAKSILAGRDDDVEIGLGVGHPSVDLDYREDLGAEEYRKGMVFHSDAGDLAIEKAFRDHGDGTTVFAQTSTPGLDLRSPMLNARECGTCGSLTKSFLTRCDVCGTNHAPGVRPGVSYSSELQKSLSSGGGGEEISELFLD